MFLTHLDFKDSQDRCLYSTYTESNDSLTKLPHNTETQSEVAIALQGSSAFLREVVLGYSIWIVCLRPLVRF